MKTDMKALVIATYGFVVSSKKATIEQNKKKYVMLATHGAFTCKICMSLCSCSSLSHCSAGAKDLLTQVQKQDYPNVNH